jgi:hypothetical protein
VPSVDFFYWCIDVLASRYGWTKQYCEENLYWEEFQDLVQMAANFMVEEKNSEFKFQFMLQADQKSRDSWKDFELPFPKENQEKEDISGTKKLPKTLERFVYIED